MRPAAAAFLAIAVGAVSVPSGAAQTPDDLRRTVNAHAITLLAGDIDSTYLRIAGDIASVLDNGDDMRVVPVLGKGGAQNVRDLIYLRGIDLAIVRSDALTAFAGDPRYPDIGWQLRYVTRLFNEELHLLAGADIASVADLDGKRVNFGVAGSGTQLTARMVFSRLGIAPVEVNAGQAEALEQLKAGNVDATILVAGKPAPVLADAAIDREKFHLLNVGWSQPLRADYRPAELTHDDYPNLLAPGERVDTIAAAAVLAAYNWPEDSERFQRIASFVEAFLERSGDLGDALHHPKWAEFDVAVPLAGWTRFAAADAWLDRNGIALATRRNDLRTEFAAFLEGNVRLSGTLSNEQRDLLFRQFTIWRRANQTQPQTATAN